MNSRNQIISKRPTVFLRLFGISILEFEKIRLRLRPLWEAQVLGAYKHPGRHFKLCLEDMALVLLLYYRSYTIQLLVGCWFGIDASRVCRIIKLLEPLLAQLMTIDKDRKLSGQEVEELLMDATEQAIERPEKRQKLYYSGKKKRHTMENRNPGDPSGTYTPCFKITAWIRA
jgi:hypothetical protein